MSPKQGSHAPPTPNEPPPSLKKSRRILKELSGYLDNCLDSLVPKLRGELRYSQMPQSSSILSSQHQFVHPLDLMNRTFQSTRAIERNREASLQFRNILDPALNFNSMSPIRPRTQGGASKYVPKRVTPDKMQSGTHQSSKAQLTKERPKSQDKLQVSAVGSIIERSPSHDQKFLSRKVSFAQATTLLQSRPIKIRNPKASDSSLQIDLEKTDVVIPTAHDSPLKPITTLRTTPLFISDSEDQAQSYRHILTTHSTTPHDLQGQTINLDKLRHRSQHPLVRLPQPRKLTKDGKRGLRQIFQHLPRELPSFEPKKLPKASFKLNNRMPLYPGLLDTTHSTSLPLIVPKSQKNSKQSQDTKPKREIIVIQDGQDLENGNALKMDLGLFQGKYTWIVNESDVPGSKKQVSEAIEKQREFQQLQLDQFLEFCSYHLGKGEKEFNFISLIDGTPLLRLQDIPDDTQCLVVSEHEHFLGISFRTGYSGMFEQRKNPILKERMQAHLHEIKSKWIISKQREWRSHSSPYLDNNNSLQHLRSTNSPPPLKDRKLKVVLSKNQGFFKLSRDPEDLTPPTYSPLPQDSSRRVLKNYSDLLAHCSSNVTKTVKTQLSEKRGLHSFKLKQKKGGSGGLVSGRGQSTGREGDQTRRAGGRGEDGFEKSNLDYDEVRSLAHRYHLPNKFIYEIFSEFIAMREMILKEKNLSRRELELPRPIGDHGKKVWRLAIPLSFLKSSSPFFVSKHPELVRRILAAMGKL